MNDDFILLCKELYFEGITPSNKSFIKTKKYEEIVKIAKRYFEMNHYYQFAGGFQEGQYYIELWTAHLIIEYGNATNELIEYSLQVIKKYAESNVNIQVASEESKWLIEFGNARDID